MVEKDKSNICLIGSGGVGTIAAVVLEKSGRANVTTVLRSRYEIVKEKGWDIDSVDHGVLRGWKPNRGITVEFLSNVATEN
jgi:ketopantoate reductase